MQKKMNLKIKYREGFRPFAPSVLEEDIADYFDLDRPSPYMLLVTPVRADGRMPLPPATTSKRLSTTGSILSARTCRRSLTSIIRHASRA